MANSEYLYSFLFGLFAYLFFIALVLIFLNYETIKNKLCIRRKYKINAEELINTSSTNTS